MDRLLLVQWQTKSYIFLHRLLQPSPSAGCGFARRGTYLVNLLSSRQRLMNGTLRAQLRILNVHAPTRGSREQGQGQPKSADLANFAFLRFFRIFYFLFCTYDSSATEQKKSLQSITNLTIYQINTVISLCATEKRKRKH